jgi:predicted phosphohydrolase
MDFQFCSDLHLEFGENREWLGRHPLKPSADVLLLAGDVVCFSKIEQADWFFDWVSRNFLETYWVPGNHEYYHSSINNSATLHRIVRSNIHVVDNMSVDFGNVAVHFTTLWTDIQDNLAEQIEKQLSDFHLIKAGGERISPAYVNGLHAQSKKYLAYALAQHRSKKQLVVSHHVPTYQNYPKQYSGSALNSAFAVEMDDLITEFQPVAWIYGHSHINVPTFKINRTELLTNQLGYSWRGEGNGFEIDAIVKA